MTENGNLADPVAPEGAPDRVKFDYIKSGYFRVVHADGVHGGVTPRLDIHMSVWSQRLPIPRQVVHEVAPDGALGSEIERTGRDAVVREVEVGIVIDLELAKSIIKWLQDKVAQVEEIRSKKAEEHGSV